MCITEFERIKSDLSTIGFSVISELSIQGIKVQSIRCDNARENLKFEEECKNQGLKVKFEYTTPGTPQQNGKVRKEICHPCRNDKGNDDSSSH